MYGYLAVFFIGGAFGAWICLWWTDYLDDTADERSIRRYDQARQARCGNRWL